MAVGITVEGMEEDMECSSLEWRVVLPSCSEEVSDSLSGRRASSGWTLGDS